MTGIDPDIQPVWRVVDGERVLHTCHSDGDALAWVRRRRVIEDASHPLHHLVLDEPLGIVELVGHYCPYIPEQVLKGRCDDGAQT